MASSSSSTSRLLAAAGALLVLGALLAHGAPTRNQQRQLQQREQRQLAREYANQEESEEPAGDERQASSRRQLAAEAGEESGPDGVMNEANAEDPEFNALTSDADSSTGQPDEAPAAQEDEEPARPARAAASRASARTSSLLGNPLTAAGAEASNIDAAEIYDDEPTGQDSNIASARVRLSAADLTAAAGHHHHHHHSVHGWLKMGAHTGKKGAFGWHSKHPVGGKGRR